jgi:hypothetical protein
MLGRNALAMLTLCVLTVLASDRPAKGQDRSTSRSVDVQPRPLDWITPGTVIGEGAPKGWTDLILFATPRIGAGDVDQVPRTAASYSSMFLFTIVAKVKGDAQAGYSLEKVAIGTAMNIGGRNVIADGENTFGADLGMIGRRVLAENEKILKSDVRQVARTATMVVFDANAFVLRNQKHRSMVIRHAIVASPTTGKVSTFVWLMGSDGGTGYALADKGLQKLPTGFREDRVLSVDGQKFTLGIPSPDAFALARLPQGASLGFSEALKAVAATRQFTPSLAQKLEAELQARYAPAVARAKTAGPVRQ